MQPNSVFCSSCGRANAQNGPSPALELEPQEIIHFQVHHPKQVSSETWSTLLAYVYVADAGDAVEADCRARLGPHIQNYAKAVAAATHSIDRKTVIRVVPYLPGCRFNPPNASVSWEESWHRSEFRGRADPALPGFTTNGITQGAIEFYVGPILLGEVRIWTHFAEPNALTDSMVSSRAEAYQAIFVSYSRQDALIVDELERAYVALGMKYLRDVRSLRSGGDWNAALLEMIDHADIFQLCWSQAAKKSSYVEREWRRALMRNRESFVRPLYWEDPMPPPPAELASLHFARYEIR